MAGQRGTIGGSGSRKIIAAGSKDIPDAATPLALTATSTPCSAVWIGAPCDANGAATNTKPAFIGITGSGTQVIPLAVSNFEGFTIPCEDAADVFIKVGVNGNDVMYAIFR